MGDRRKLDSADADRVLGPNEEELRARPTWVLDALEVFTSEEQRHLTTSAPTATLAVSKGSTFQIIHLDQPLNEFASEEGLTGSPKNEHDALEQFAAEEPRRAPPSVLRATPAVVPRIPETHLEQWSPIAWVEEASAPSAAVPAFSAPVTRRTHTALAAAAATIVVLSVGAIGMWWIALQPEEAVSRGAIGRQTASNQLPAAPLTQAEQPDARPDEGAIGTSAAALQPAGPLAGLSSPVATGDLSPLEAPTARPPSSLPPPTPAEQISSSIPPVTSTSAPQVTTTPGAAEANLGERPAPEAPTVSNVAPSDTATPAGNSPVSSGADPVLRTAESSATDTPRTGLTVPSPAGPPAAPLVEAPAPPSVNEAAAVRDLLARYRTAYEQLDARLAKQIWPSVDERALARAFDGLESQAMRFESCNVDVGEGRAAAFCRGTATYVRRVGNKSSQTQGREWTFVLRKAERGWFIQAVQMR